MAIGVAVVALLLAARQTPSIRGAAPGPGMHYGLLSSYGQRVTVTSEDSVIRTNVELSYQNPIVTYQSASIDVRITQKRGLVSESEYKIELKPASLHPHPPEELTNSEWPMEISISSPAFEMEADEITRRIPEGTPLPVELVWTAMPKSAGHWDFVVKLSKIYPDKITDMHFRLPRNLDLNLNGKTRSVGSASDIALPIDVYKAPWISAGLYTVVSLTTAIVAFVTGSELLWGWLSRIWKYLAPGKELRPRRRK